MAIDPWAGYNAGMQNLGSTFEDIRKQNKEAPLKALQLRMMEQKAQEGDIALENAKVSAADRLALRQKLTNAMPTQQTTIGAGGFNTPQPELSQNAALYANKPAAEALTTMPGQQYLQPTDVSTKEIPPDLVNIARTEYLKQGNLEGAAKATELQAKTISIDDLLAKKKAEANMYGSPEQKAKLDVEEARLKTAESIILTSRKADPSGGMTRQMIKAHPELFPGIDPDMVVTKGGVTTMPFEGGKLVTGEDGKTHVIKDNEVDKYINAQKRAYKSQLGADMPDNVEADLRMKFHRALKPETNIRNTVINKEQGAEAATVGKGQGERYNKIVEAGDAGFKSINMYSRMENLLDGVKTGKLTPTGTQIAALADSFGLKIDKNLPNKQAAIALGNQLALELRNPAGGAGMPGAMSDPDREFLMSSVPNINKTPQGNKLMIEYAKKIAKRNVEVAKLATQYRQKHGTLDIGFNDLLTQWSDSHPLFTSKQKQSGRFTVEEVK